MWKFQVVPILGVLLVPVALHGQCMAQQGGMQRSGQGMQMGMQMGNGQHGEMMQRNLVRDIVADAATLQLTQEEIVRLEPLAERLDAMNAMFQGIHRSGAGMTLTPAGRDSLRTTHMGVRRTNQEEVLEAVQAVLGVDRYIRALELLVVRKARTN